MSTLLVQSCSATKHEVAEPTPALEVYDGYFYRIIKKAIRENEFRSDIDICILSAEHGILAQDDYITSYDRRMSASRADELQEAVTESLTQRINEGNYESVVLNVGSIYRRAIGNLESSTNVAVSAIDGKGIGAKGKILKQFVRAEPSASGVTL